MIRFIGEVLLKLFQNISSDTHQSIWQTQLEEEEWWENENKRLLVEQENALYLHSAYQDDKDDWHSSSLYNDHFTPDL